MIIQELIATVSESEYSPPPFIFQAQIDHYLGLANKNVKDALAK